MIQRLPAEIIELILSHLPSVADIVAFASVNKRVRQIYGEHDHALLRGFVQRAFPTVSTPPRWQEVAFALTSRSRAWDRRGILAREIMPPRGHASLFQSSYTHGQRPGWNPVIDSYETYADNTRKECIAYSAAGRLKLRILEDGKVDWNFFATEDDHHAMNDILGLNMLRPHQRNDEQGETIALHRANGCVELIEYSHADKQMRRKATSQFRPQEVDCVAVNSGREPMLAVCGPSHISLARSAATERGDLHFSKHRTELNLAQIYKVGTAKYLSDDRIAMGIHYLNGRDKAPIYIFDTSQERTASSFLEPLLTLTGDHPSLDSVHANRASAFCLADLDAERRPGTLLLSGWSDGMARLHDVRTGPQPVRLYEDIFDDGQLVSILPFGQEAFLAGGARYALLKMFDLRMHRASYCYQGHRKSPLAQVPGANPPNGTKHSYRTRDLNVFLAVHVPRPRPHGILQPSSHRQNAKLPRYRKGITSLSAPSPWSSKVYAGIEDRVIQLDFVSTDDIKAKRGGIDETLKSNDSPILDLSCYERPFAVPDAPHVAASLCKQRDWSEIVRQDLEADRPGWDERWMVDKRRSWR